MSLMNYFFVWFPGDCDPGYYCERKAESSTPTDGATGNVCPIGTYCPVGTAQPLPCEDGRAICLFISFSHDKVIKQLVTSYPLLFFSSTETLIHLLYHMSDAI